MRILHTLDKKRMFRVRIFGIQRGQRDSAAADHRIARAMDHVAADGADVKPGTDHIAGTVAVDDLLTVHQFNDRNIQRLRQRLNQRQIRQSFPRFPFGNGLVADADPFAQFGLGQMFVFPQLANGIACDIGIHCNHSFSAVSIS